jgi:acetoin utilization deacetylase AcuC-like enzyme
MTFTTGFVWHEKTMWHDNGSAAGLSPATGQFQPGIHVENPETKRRLKNLLDAYGVTPQLTPLTPSEVEESVLTAFHTPDYVELVKSMSKTAGGSVGESAWAGPGTFDIARLAVGGTLTAIDAVVRGDCKNSYALMRPPGHHAERDRGRGFCVFNNIALAILEARKQHAIERVAVVDWDVHHGNGTQQAFFNDPGVLTVSLHQEMLYPVNLGKLTETGEGDGEGYNINVPLPAGSGGEAYLLAMRNIVVPALVAYKPQLIVVACGFDASYFDPMSHMLLISTHFRTMTDMMRDTAAQLCESRLVLNHEGGYSEFYVPFCGIAAIEGLSGIDSGVTDPYRGTASVDNQRIQPHQQAAIDAAIHGPLALLMRRHKS